jgi:hypothetical protein
MPQPKMLLSLHATANNASNMLMSRHATYPVVMPLNATSSVLLSIHATANNATVPSCYSQQC